MTALGVLGLASCSASESRVEISPPPALLHAVAVMPLELAYDSEPFEAQRRTGDILAALWHRSGWTVLTPDEFAVRDPTTGDLLHGTDLVFRGRDLGLDPRRFAVLRSRASLREARGEATVAGEAGVAVGRDFASRAVVTLELVAMDSSPIADVEVIRDIEPFADRPDYDRLPVVRDAIGAAVDALVEACSGFVVSRPRPALPVFTNPAALLEARDARGRSLSQMIDARDPLERDQLLWRTMQYARPTLDLPEAQRLARTPLAACVGSQPPGPLAEGDCIVAVDDDPIDGVHALGRALATAGRHTLTVVTAAGQQRLVRWPLATP